MGKTLVIQQTPHGEDLVLSDLDERGVSELIVYDSGGRVNLYLDKNDLLSLKEHIDYLLKKC